MKPLAVAPAYGKNHIPGKPALSPEGGAGRRLAMLIGVADHLSLMDTTNLTAYCGSNGKGDAFTLAEGRAAAADLDLTGRPLVILVGHNVVRSFGVHVEPLERFKIRGVPALMIPHPSGVNHWYNNSTNRIRTRAALRSALQLD